MPNATVVHGTDATREPAITENDLPTGRQLLRGAQILFDNGFYSTCALRTIDVVRRYPSLRTFDAGWLTAESLEHAGLKGEALNAYNDVMPLAVTAGQQEQTRTRISTLRAAH
jgi:hypothetical protein